jgi:hypothetical protein
MTHREHHDDDETRLLQDAKEELRQARRRSERMTPLLDKLDDHLREDWFAKQFIAAVKHDARRQS